MRKNPHSLLGFVSVPSSNQRVRFDSSSVFNSLDIWQLLRKCSSKTVSKRWRLSVELLNGLLAYLILRLRACLTANLCRTDKNPDHILVRFGSFQNVDSSSVRVWF